MELHCVLLSSYLGLTGFSELVLLELGLPFKVTELALRLFVLLAQSLCFSLTAQLVHFFCFLVAAQSLRFLVAAQLLRLLTV